MAAFEMPPSAGSPRPGEITRRDGPSAASSSNVMASLRHTRGAAHRGGREARPHQVEGGEARPQAALHVRDQVHHVRITLDREEFRYAYAAKLADPAQVVAAQVDQHNVLGALLGIGAQFGLQAG